MDRGRCRSSPEGQRTTVAWHGDLADRRTSCRVFIADAPGIYAATSKLGQISDARDLAAGMIASRARHREEDGSLRCRVGGAAPRGNGVVAARSAPPGSGHVHYRCPSCRDRDHRPCPVRLQRSRPADRGVRRRRARDRRDWSSGLSRARRSPSARRHDRNVLGLPHRSYVPADRQQRHARRRRRRPVRPGATLGGALAGAPLRPVLGPLRWDCALVLIALAVRGAVMAVAGTGIASSPPVPNRLRRARRGPSRGCSPSPCSTRPRDLLRRAGGGNPGR